MMVYGGAVMERAQVWASPNMCRKHRTESYAVREFVKSIEMAA